MVCKKWKINDDLICQRLTWEYLEEMLVFIENEFFKYENVSRTLKVFEDEEALSELRQLTREAARDGVSLVVIDIKRNKIAGVAVNKLMVKDKPPFGSYISNWKNSKSKAIVQFLTEFEKNCDFFKICNIDCALELLFLSTSIYYRGKGIGKQLTQATIEIGKNLRKGVNVKHPLHSEKLALEPVPKLITTLFTSHLTQKIGKDLGFKVAFEKCYSELEFENLDFSDVIQRGAKKITLEYRKL